MSKEKKYTPLYMELYRNHHKKKRITEQKGRTEASRSGFYVTKAWRKLRARRIREYPLCESCLKKGWYNAGQVVDHIKPVEQRPDLALVYDNLQTLCYKCHDWKTKQDQQTTKQEKRLAKGKILMAELESKPAPRGVVLKK